MKYYYLPIAILLIALSGCASVGTKVDQSALSKIEKGKTTRSELLTLLGKPNSSTLASDGTETLAWVYAKAKMKGATFIPVVGIFAGGSDVESATFTATIGPDKVVKEYTSSTSNTEVRNM